MPLVEIFYHLYIPSDWKCCLWTQFLDTHLRKLTQTKLLNLATFNLAITMPRHWTSVAGLDMVSNIDPAVRLTFENKVREYINTRYPFINILDVRDTGEPNIFEGQTLNLLYQRAHQIDGYFLYLHSKGITNYSPAASIDNWREILDYYLIDKWPNNLKLLETYDVVGIKDAISIDRVLSGNFWWSKSQHIRRLLPPLNTTDYYEGEAHMYRLAFERWIMTGDARYHYLVDTKTNHYLNYCFLENLPR